MNDKTSSQPQKPNLAEAEENLRPRRLINFIGQDELRANLAVFIKAALERGSALDHTLFYGPPGLGKTTLAGIMAVELGVNIVGTSGPVLERGGDLAAILTNLNRHDILFIDEIHRMPASVEEILYPAMEDFHLDLIIGQGPGARTVKISLEPFTLVGATTRLGLLTSPLRDRFGFISRLDFYSPAELTQIIHRAATIQGIKITTEGAQILGKRSRGTPRIAGRLLRRVRDFAMVEGRKEVSEEICLSALEKMEVDPEGLDAMDRKILFTILHQFEGGPVGVKTLAASLSEDVKTLEDIYEPFLIQSGLIKRTSKGRVATAKAFMHMKGLLRN